MSVNHAIVAPLLSNAFATVAGTAPSLTPVSSPRGLALPGRFAGADRIGIPQRIIISSRPVRCCAPQRWIHRNGLTVC